MSFRDDERGVTVQIGAVLLLGILVVLMSVYQVSVVPDQNGGIEFVHSQDALADVENLRNAILTTASADSTRPVSVTLGTTYPTRTVFVNPPPPTGSLRTAEAGTLALANARATDAETSDYLDGTADVEYATTSIRYDPGYNVYRNAPTTVYENTLVYNRFPNGANLTETGQSLIDGRRLNLVVLRGNLSENGLSTTVDPTAESAAVRTVPVTGEGGNVVLRVPSSLPESTWRELLEDEMSATGDGYVESVAKTGSEVVITLAAGETYELRSALVGIGTGSTTPEAEYITDVRLPDPSVDNDTTHRVVLEVRDRFNNPVSAESVTADAPLGSFDQSTRDTDEQGRVAFEYTAPGPAEVGNRDSLSFEIAGNTSEKEHVRHGVEITGAGDAAPGSGGGTPGNNINPNSTNAVVLAGADIVDGDNSLINVGLRNLDASSAQNITNARFNFYSVDSQGGGEGSFVVPKSADITNTSQTLTAANEGGQYVALSPKFEIGAGQTETLQLRFFENADGTSPYDVQQGDFFVFSIIIDERRSATYFVAPTLAGSIGTG